MHLLRIEIRNFRGIVSLDIEPRGKNVKLKGDNGVGKSSAVDALFWGLGGNLDEDVITNGEDKAETEVEFGDYRIIRKQTRGKKPSLVLKSIDGKTTFNSPGTLLAGFKEALDRHTFSHKTPKEQAEVLRKLAPSLDTSALDAEHDEKYAERTNVNRELKSLTAQADAIPSYPPIGTIEPDIDIVAIAEKKADAEKKRAQNDSYRQQFRAADIEAGRAFARYEERKAEFEKAKKALQDASQEAEAAKNKRATLESTVAALIDPDTSAIDAEIEKAKGLNEARRQMRESAQRDIERREQRDRLKAQAREKEKESEALTRRLEQIEKEKARQLKDAKLPIDGLAIDGDNVTLTEGKNGPVAIGALNTATRIKLDIAIAAALGNKIAVIHEASLLGSARKDIVKLANEFKIQLIEEIVVMGEPLTAEIAEE